MESTSSKPDRPRAGGERTMIYMWIANDQPVPPGWRICRAPWCHHNAYARLIVRL